MPVIAHLRRTEQVLRGRGTLLSLALRAGIPVGNSCSGRGECFACVVTVLEGLDALTPPTEAERRVLERSQARPDQRLSCQCRATGTATVRITTGYW